MQTQQNNFGSNQKPEPHGVGHVEGGEVDAGGSLPSRVVGRAIQNAGIYMRGVPAQLRANPLAVLGVGIGVGVAIGTLVSPFSRLLAPRSGLSGLIAYRKQVMRALGI